MDTKALIHYRPTGMLDKMLNLEYCAVQYFRMQHLE